MSDPCLDTQHHLVIDAEPAEALLAGTLCLMSCAMRSGPGLYRRKIIENLDRLADHRDVSSNLRVICRRLAGHWEREADECATGEDSRGLLHEMLRSRSLPH